MILDSSAIIAIVLQEPGYEVLLKKLVEADAVRIGAPTLAETGIVLTNRLEKEATAVLVQFLHEWEISVIAFGGHHWSEAMEAYRRFGKGRHKAGLNYGDCLSYATARLAGETLLCTGDDFPKTDLELA
jgi:ribonuclease VapC